MANKISLLEVKQALRDERFRKSLPPDMRPELDKYLSNPSCACNTGFYRAILQKCRTQIGDYFPGKEIEEPQDEVEKLSANNWTVINCPAADLEARLKKLPNGRKQITVARWEDQVTVIVNELDVIF